MRRFFAVLVFVALACPSFASWTTETLSNTQYCIGDTSNTAINHTYTIRESCSYDEVRFLMDGAQTSTISVTLISKHGAAYNFPMVIAATWTQTDYGYMYRNQPTRPVPLAVGDVLKFECYNASNRTWSIHFILNKR